MERQFHTERSETDCVRSILEQSSICGIPVRFTSPFYDCEHAAGLPMIAIVPRRFFSPVPANELKAPYGGSLRSSACLPRMTRMTSAPAILRMLLVQQVSASAHSVQIIGHAKGCALGSQVARPMILMPELVLVLAADIKFLCNGVFQAATGCENGV